MEKLKVIYEDNHIIVVEKTPNIASQADKTGDIDMLTMVKQYINEIKNLSLLKVNLHTGRHHQIRVQLSHFGHSIFGDQKYGTRGKGKQIALWAYELKIVHPTTKKELKFTCYPESVGTWSILKKL